MDRYTFRGKREDDGEWTCGVYMPGKGELDPPAIGTWREDGRFWDWSNIDPATLGQCTGLTAAKSYRGNGTDDLMVFEGDIDQDGRVLVYVESGGFFAFYAESSNGSLYPEYLRFDDIDLRELEIIGTIHDNPDGEGE